MRRLLKGNTFICISILELKLEAGGLLNLQNNAGCTKQIAAAGQTPSLLIKTDSRGKKVGWK